MPSSPTFKKRKRSWSQHPTGEAADPDPQSKKQKLCNSPARSVSPPHWLDSLSTIWLTRGALREFDRRNIEVGNSHQNQFRGRRPLTRGFRAELRRRIPSRRLPVSGFLRQYTSGLPKELKLFARHGGPSLVDLRGYSEPAQPPFYTMSSRRPIRRQKRGKGDQASSSQSHNTITNSQSSKVTKASGSYGANFRQRLIDNGIFPDGYEYPNGRIPPKPDNWYEIKQMLAKPQRSLSPSIVSEEEHDKFTRLVKNRVTSESKATRLVLPMIQGPIRDERCIDGPDIRFANLTKLMTGRDHKAKPDIWYGARPEQIDPSIRDNKALGVYIVPSVTGSRPCAPNFFIEVKGPKGSNEVAENQACFDGAVGARGMHKLQTYNQQVPMYDRRAYTLSTTYHSGILRIYAHHLDQPNGSGTRLEYYMNEFDAWALTGNKRNLLEGMTAVRNAEHWTEAQRNAAIEHANNIARESIPVGEAETTAEVTADSTVSSVASHSPFSAQMVSRNGKIRQDSNTSAEEFAQDFRPSEHYAREARYMI